MNKDGKRYGLIMPKKAQLSTPSATNVFGDNDDSDQDDGVDWVKKALKAEGDKHRVKKQTKLNMQKALNEDPTIYQYDEIYDDMEKTKEQAKVVEKTEAKKPKYIHSLLRAADRRKREQEHRIERMVQKEREAEGNEFADKESFVTSAYRAKLEEFKKMEEEEARMNRLEAIGDVTKQPDISGFYRQLYAQTVDKKDDGNDEGDAEIVKSADVDKNDGNQDNDTSLSENSGSDSEENLASGSEFEEPGDGESTRNHRKTDKKISSKLEKRNRQYRKRNVESSESEEEHPEDGEEEREKEGKSARKDEEKEEKEGKSSRSRRVHDKILSKKTNNHDRNNGDDGSDKKESEEDEEASPKKKQKLSKENRNQKNSANVDKSLNEKADNFRAPENKTDKSETNKDKEDSEEQVKENKENRKKEQRKVSIWEKRTVGPVFEAALQRYYARKAMRLSGS